MKYEAIEPSTQPMSYRAVMLPCMPVSGLSKSRAKRLSAPMMPDITPVLLVRG